MSRSSSPARAAPARRSSPRRCTRPDRAASRRSSASTAGQSRRTSSRASCLATCAEPSPGPIPNERASSARPRAARSSSTRLGDADEDAGGSSPRPAGEDGAPRRRRQGRARATRASSPRRTASCSQMVAEGTFREDLYITGSTSSSSSTAAARARRRHPPRSSITSLCSARYKRDRRTSSAPPFVGSRRSTGRATCASRARAADAWLLSEENDMSTCRRRACAPARTIGTATTALRVCRIRLESATTASSPGSGSEARALRVERRSRTDAGRVSRRREGEDPGPRGATGTACRPRSRDGVPRRNFYRRL